MSLDVNFTLFTPNDLELAQSMLRYVWILKFWGCIFENVQLIALVSSAYSHFANRLGPDQARQNVGPDLDPISNGSDTQMVFLKEFFENVILETKSADYKKHEQFPGGGGGGRERPLIRLPVDLDLTDFIGRWGRSLVSGCSCDI